MSCPALPGVCRSPPGPRIGQPRCWLRSVVPQAVAKKHCPWLKTAVSISGIRWKNCMHSITLDPPMAFTASRAAAPGHISLQKAILMVHATLIALLAGWSFLYPAFQFDAEQML